MSRPLLEARGIEKRFGAVTALKGLDLDLATHSIVAVVGPNGAGKSTLLKLLAGIARPSAGRIIRAGGADRRSDVGYLGHATLLYAELTAAENLELAGRLHGVDDPRARARALLEREGLLDVADRRAGTFSRGMAQRLSIARALVHAPAVLLLDEPFTGLDLPSAERLSLRLGELRSEGHGLVLVTHDIVQAGRLADRVVVLRAGRVAFVAESDELQGEGLARRYGEALTAPGGAA